MTVTEALESRRATRSFETAISIGQVELLALMNKACLAPSAMNLQPWRFMILTSQDERQRLYDASCPQRKVLDVGTVLVIFGDLELDKVAPKMLVGQFLEIARSTYRNSIKARDEAVRGASLWAMAFVLLAQEAGWQTAMIGGFDSSGLSSEFNVSDRYLPVLLVAIGRSASETELSRQRIPAQELLIPTPPRTSR